MKIQFFRNTVLVLLVVSCLVFTCGCSEKSAPTPVEQLQEAGSHAAALLGQVHVAAQEGRFAQGILIADSLIRVAPELPQGYYEKGLLLIQLHQLEAADKNLQLTLERDPYHRGAWYQRGHVAFQQRMYRYAIERYERQRNMIEASPGNLRAFYRDTDLQALPQIWLQVGRSYELLNVADSAKWAYDNVLKLDSTHAQAHSWLSILLKEEGDAKAAMSHSQKALYYNSNNPEFAYQLGLMYFENGELEEAIPFLDRVVQKQPWNASAHYNLGRSLVGVGRTEEGEKHLEKVDRLQDLGQSIEYAKAAVAQFPDEPARWRQLAQLLGQAGRAQEQQQIQQVIRGLSDYNRNEQVEGVQ